MVRKTKINIDKILVFAIHPDDETLGCGGTLLRHKANGDEIYWLICTNLDKMHDYYLEREKEITDVAKAYKFDGVFRLGLKTTKIDEYGVSDLIGKISAIINEIKPSVIYLPFCGDVHSDHRKIFEAAYSCTKTFRYPFIKKIYMMEILSETEFAPSLAKSAFVPNVFVDISKFFSKKADIMRTYKSELSDFPFPRSLQNLEALAKFRGATSGCKYAESFMLLKEIL